MIKIISKELKDKIQEGINSYNTKAEKKWNSLSQETKLHVTSYIFNKLIEHYQDNKGYNALLRKLGFGLDEYGVIQVSGGLEISNYLGIAKDYKDK